MLIRLIQGKKDGDTNLDTFDTFACHSIIYLFHQLNQRLVNIIVVDVTDQTFNRLISVPFIGHGQESLDDLILVPSGDL